MRVRPRHLRRSAAGSARGLLVRARDLTTHESNVLLFLSFIVGILAGGGAILLEESLRFFSKIFLGAPEPTTTALARVAIAPVVGGLIVGPLIMRLAHEAKGHGVPEVIEAVALRGGRIRARVALVKTIASAITIGSGGSAGREGPIVQVGATLGSRVALWTRMSEDRVRVLVAAGAAGGVSAAFNAPLAGVFFALEVVLQRFTTRGFATVVVSAVTSSVIWRARYGNASVLRVPQFGLQSPLELVFYVVLGLLAAVVALSFVRTLYWFEDRFDRLPTIADVKPAIGGALLGWVGIATVLVAGAPLVYGSGLLGIDLALAGSLAPLTLLFLLAAKLLATSLTLGSGASGGVFAPSLFMGAMLGAAFGQGLDHIAGGLVAPSGAYAMVGMAAVFAAAGQAPISAILILFEMTNDYRIILPLMLACIVATTVYSIVQHESIYLTKTRRKGIDLKDGRERHLLERIPVREAMVDGFRGSRTPPTVEAAIDWIRRREADWMFCVDDRGRFVGLLSRERVEAAGRAEEDVTVAELLDTDVIPLIPDESLDEAFRKMARRGLVTLPVIADLTSRRIVGAVTRESLSAAYWGAVASEGLSA